MATRSEQSRAEEQRSRRAANSGTKKTGGSKPGVAPRDRSASKEHAGKKATYALEAPIEGRPSRKSTRKSANRSKPDSGMNIREALQKGTPEAKYRKARAGSVRARGSGSKGKTRG